MPMIYFSDKSDASNVVNEAHRQLNIVAKKGVTDGNYQSKAVNIVINVSFQVKYIL